MDNLPPTTAPDWSLVRAFLAVADTGSLSGAAQQLGSSQPTLGRQINALENALDTALFARHARGLRLTETGGQLLPMARKMAEAMADMTLTAAGRTQDLAGSVRITASVFASHHVLPSVLAQIRAAEPSIRLILTPTDRPENLLFREADIAVRMFRPTQLDVVTRLVGTIEMGIFAATSYLERAGRPATLADVLDHDLIGFETSELIIRTMREYGWNRTLEDFATRCDDHAVCWQLLRAGCGIGFSQSNIGRADPLVEELELGLKIPPLEIWLAAHQAMRHSPRIRRVWDLLSQGLRAYGR